MSNVEDNNADNENIKHHAINNHTACKSQEKNGSDEMILGAVSDTTAADLKNIFIAGAIPLEGSFSNLIDLAEVSRKAVGLNGASDESGDGLALTNEVLEVASDPDGGMAVGDAGVRIAESDSIAVSNNGISVITNTNRGINTSTAGVGAIPNTNLGVDMDANGLKVVPYHGIEVTADGITVTPAPDGGMEVTAAGVGLKAGNGTIATDQGLKVVAGGGVKVDANGVAINYGRGLSTEGNQLISLNSITSGATFPSNSQNGNVHYRLLGDLWELLPDKLNAVAGVRGRIFADGNAFLAVFSLGEICISRDNGRTWYGGYPFEDAWALAPISVSFKYGAAAVSYATPPGFSSIVMWSDTYGSDWTKVGTSLTRRSTFTSTAICGSHLYLCGENLDAVIATGLGRGEVASALAWNKAIQRKKPNVVTSNGHFIFSSTKDGAYTARTLNGGEDWSSGSSIGTDSQSIVQAVMNDNAAIIIRYTVHNYLAYSHNNGSGWALTAAGLDPANAISGDIGWICTFEEKFYASGLNSQTNLYGIYESVDNGVSWYLMQGIPDFNLPITLARTKDSMIIMDSNAVAWGTYSERYVYLDGEWHLQS